MPTNRTRRTRRQIGSNGISEIEFSYFTVGGYFDAEVYEIGKSKEELQAFWKKNRAVIMTRYLEEKRARGNVGSRPWPVWDWELTEPRLTTEPKEFSSSRVYDHLQHKFDWVENDIEYLKRLGLLEPWELETFKNE